MVASLVDAKAMAEQLAMRPRTLLDLARRNRVPCIRVSRRIVRFDATAVLRALGTGSAPVPSPPPAAALGGSGAA